MALPSHCLVTNRVVLHERILCFINSNIQALISFVNVNQTILFSIYRALSRQAADKETVAENMVSDRLTDPLFNHASDRET